MANEQRINDIIDIAAITKQVEATEQQLGRIVTTIAEINKSGVTFKGTDSKGIPDATKQIDELGRATQKLANLQTDAGKAEYQNIQATKELTKAQQLQAQAANDQAGAYSKLMAQTQLANKAARDMAAQYGTNSQQFKDAAKTANDLNTKLKDIDAEINIHSKNVGNYGGAVTSLRQEIKNLTQTLATMEMQGKNNSKEYKTMVMRLGELKDAVGDVQARSKFFADDARYLNTVTQAVQGVVGAYSVWVGASELLGTKNEELEKIMRKMMALMTIMQGLSQVQKMLDKDSYVRVAAGVAIEKLRVLWTNAGIVSINAETGAIVKATAAQRAYNIMKTASKGLIGLLIAGVAALIYAMKKEADSVYGVSEMEKKLTESRIKAMDNYVNKEIAISRQISILNNETTSLDQQKQAIIELDKEMGTNLQSITDINKAKMVSVSLADLYIDKLRKEAEAEAAKELYVDAFKEKLKAEQSSVEDNIKWWDILLSYMGAFTDVGVDPFEEGAERQGKAIKKTTDEADKMYAVFSSLQDASDKAAASFEEMASKYLKSKDKLKEVTETEKENIDVMKLWDELKKKNADSQKTINDLLGIKTEETKELTMTEKSLADEYLILDKNLNKLIKTIKEVPEARKKLITQEDIDKFQKYTDALMEIASAFSQVMDNLNKKELDKYKIDQEEYTRILNERLRLGLISQEKYNADISDLNIEYDRKKRELEKQEFERKKKMAIAEAMIAAAVGVMKEIEKEGALGILAGLLIAAELVAKLAVISSQSPGYAKGRDGGPAEFANVGEQGFEYISTDTGLFKTPNHSTLTYLPSGASVIPHEKSLKIENYLNTPHIYNEKQKESKENKELLNELKKLNSKPNTSINIDKHGFAVMMAKGGSYVNFVNDHIRIKH